MMNIDLHECALKMHLSTDNVKLRFQEKEIHVCFASVHALEKYIGSNDLGVMCTEIGLSLLQQFIRFLEERNILES